MKPVDGFRPNGKHHGHSGTAEYRSWHDMRYRCENAKHPHYKTYGGRGISVCPQWRQSFMVFLADMGSRPSPLHTLDRYPDMNGNYEPGNCRWATRAEQAENRRTTKLLTHNGATWTIKRWAEITGIPQRALTFRIWKGWQISTALTTPHRDPGRFFTHDGKTLTLRDWAEVMGTCQQNLQSRLKLGWSVHKTLSTPIYKERRPIDSAGRFISPLPEN